MKLLLNSIFILFLSSAGMSQTYDSIANLYYKIDNQFVNFTDSLGQKQGLWIEYRIVRLLNFDSYHSNPQYSTSIRKLGQGYYKNNKKSGLWEYYRDHRCIHETIATENYFEDGKVEEWIYEFTIVNNYSVDSNYVNSEVYFKRDTILINCENKLTCLATVHGKELLKFDYTYLDYEQFRMYLGEYQRAILKLREESDF
jgi:hypothetical protein